MTVIYKAFNNVTEAIDTVHVHDVKTIREDNDSYYLMNDKGMLICNELSVIGETPTLRVFKGHIKKIKIYN